MKLIKEIYDKDLGIISEEKDRLDYELRKAARALVFDGDNKIALLYVSNKTYHKLPGGGLEGGEDIESALRREVIEETGCEVIIKEELGMTIEFRDQFEQKQESYCYVADLKRIIGQPNFTEQELAEGFALKWVDSDEAIKIIENDQPQNYVGKFIRFRDLLFLKEYKNNL